MEGLWWVIIIFPRSVIETLHKYERITVYRMYRCFKTCFNVECLHSNYFLAVHKMDELIHGFISNNRFLMKSLPLMWEECIWTATYLGLSRLSRHILPDIYFRLKLQRCLLDNLIYKLLCQLRYVVIYIIFSTKNFWKQLF